MRVLKKQFIKIPHLKKEQTVGVLGLDIQVLPEHGGDFVGGGIGHGAIVSQKRGEGARDYFLLHRHLQIIPQAVRANDRQPVVAAPQGQGQFIGRSGGGVFPAVHKPGHLGKG